MPRFSLEARAHVTIHLRDHDPCAARRETRETHWGRRVVATSLKPCSDLLLQRQLNAGQKADLRVAGEQHGPQNRPGPRARLWRRGGRQDLYGGRDEHARSPRGSFIFSTWPYPQPRRFHFKLNPYVSQTGYYTVEESGAVQKSE